MAKHQRRSHQRGIPSSELDGGDTSDYEGESPSTLQQSSQLQWSPQAVVWSRTAMPVQHQLQGAKCFAEFGQQQLETHPFPQQYRHKHSLSGGPLASNSPIPEHNPLTSQAPSLPVHSSYYVPEQNNPSMVILNIIPPQLQIYQLPRHKQSQEMLQSSPSCYSPVSRASPIRGESYYDQPTAQVATCAIRNSPLAEQVPAVQLQRLEQQSAQQQCQPAPLQDGKWYDNVIYQLPIEFVSQMQAYQAPISGSPWIQKIETCNDISLQIPSMHIENP